MQGRQLTWPASQEIVLTVARAASDSASDAATAATAVPAARSIFAFCVLSAVLYFSSSFLILYLPPPFFVYFKFLFPLHFLCVSFARVSLTGGLTMKEESCTVLTLYYPRQKKLTTCHSLPSLPTVLHSLGIEQLAT